MYRPWNIAIYAWLPRKCDYRTDTKAHGRTDRQTPGKVIPMCRYASQATQKHNILSLEWDNQTCIVSSSMGSSHFTDIACSRGGAGQVNVQIRVLARFWLCSCLEHPYSQTRFVDFKNYQSHREKSTHPLSLLLIKCFPSTKNSI